MPQPKEGDSVEATAAPATDTPAGVEPVIPAEPDKVEAKGDDAKGEESSELAELKAKLAKIEAERKESERKAMSEKERTDAELAEKQAKLDALDRQLAFREADLPQGLEALIGPVEGKTHAEQAKALKKILGASQAPTPIRGAGKPHNPSASGAKTKSDEKTPEQIERERYAKSTRMRPSSERKAS